MAEEWRDIPGFNGEYKVSNLGRVMTLKRKDGTSALMHPRINEDGYPMVHLSRDSKSHYYRIHALVASAFIGLRPEGMVVNHIDGVKTNNHLENLEYCTVKENIQHAFSTGLKSGLKGVDHPLAKFTNEQILQIRDDFSRGVSQAQIAREYGVNKTRIWSICRRISWKHI